MILSKELNELNDSNWGYIIGIVQIAFRYYNNFGWESRVVQCVVRLNVIQKIDSRIDKSIVIGNVEILQNFQSSNEIFVFKNLKCTVDLLKEKLISEA